MSARAEDDQLSDTFFFLVRLDLPRIFYHLTYLVAGIVVHTKVTCIFSCWPRKGLVWESFFLLHGEGGRVSYMT